MTHNFSGKVALITGAARGIGAGVANVTEEVAVAVLRDRHAEVEADAVVGDRRLLHRPPLDR